MAIRLAFVSVLATAAACAIVGAMLHPVPLATGSDIPAIHLTEDDAQGVP